MIRLATTADAAAIVGVYNYHILNTIVTFEETALSADEMAQRISQTASEGFPWLVWEEAGRVLGYAYAGRWKSRCSDRFSVETTIYLDQLALGRGIGTQLYSSLIAGLRPMEIHTVIGGIALPNAASVALHEKLGFRKAAHFHQVGWKFDQWIDVGYWERLLP